VSQLAEACVAWWPIDRSSEIYVTETIFQFEKANISLFEDVYAKEKSINIVEQHSGLMLVLYSSALIIFLVTRECTPLLKQYQFSLEISVLSNLVLLDGESCHVAACIRKQLRQLHSSCGGVARIFDIGWAHGQDTVLLAKKYVKTSSVLLDIYRRKVEDMV
jgi:hypothetical protein